MIDMPTFPIFYDRRRRRWPRFKRAVEFIAAVFTIMIGVAIASVLINPTLPSLGLASLRALPRARHLLPLQPGPWIPSREELAFQRTKKRLITKLANAQPAAFAPVAPARQNTSELIGFYVNWDDTSLTSLKKHLSQLDKLIPEWLHLTEGDGTIAADDPSKQAETLAYIRQHRPDLPIVPLVNNFNAQTKKWEGLMLGKMLGDPAARGRTIQNLLAFIRNNGFAGVCIDFEDVRRGSEPALKLFMRELYAQLHPLGLEVSQTVPLADPEFDYRAWAESNDYLILMAYDEHWSTSKAGPVASQRWYADGLRRCFAKLPPEKYVIAIGSYGYDWKARTTPGTVVSFQEAIKTAQESEGRITLDSAALNPTFDYYDEDDKLHHVWFLDAVTAFNQVREGQRYHPRGFAVWRLGSEDPAIWSVLDRRATLDRAAAEALRILRYGYDIDYEGQGEVLKVAATPRDGEREISYDERSGLITGERLIAYPSSYVILRWGAQHTKKIALTFDDGPDGRFTPEVLDILRRYQVPATFFLIGLNAELHPRLLQRIVDDGHEIGNHTFTHPNIADIPPWHLRVEINATERLFESRLGRRSVLFRPPYGEDVEPVTPDQVMPLMVTSGLGYYTVGMQIDPDDWRNPGVDTIVKATIEQAVDGAGHVVLLHDGGGDRSQTVAALPQIIDGLRAHGFELVTISNLLGLTRDAVMPSIAKDERVIASVNQAGFLLFTWLSHALYYVFVVGIVLGVTRFLFVGLLAVYERWKRHRTQYLSDDLPAVSVVVPAYNEEKVICQTIHALLHSDYPRFHIVVVDDGSNDGTYRCVVESFGHDPRVRAFSKANGGKAEALNHGIQQTSSEIVIALDADTIVRPDTIAKLVRHFADPHVGAVAGNTKVGNRMNLLTAWQALEYITSQNLDRRAFDVLNCITVVPGSIGAWRRELILQAGGFANDTLAEDADLTLRILRMGYKITYEEEAVAYTEAPDTVRAFLKQRFRWMYGTLQAVWKHRDVLFHARYGGLAFVALPNVWLFQICFPLASPVMDFFALGSLTWMGWQRYQHPASYSTDGFEHVLFYYALFLAIDFLAACIALLLEHKEEWGLLAWQFLQRFFYRQLMYYVAIKSLTTAIHGRIVGWGKLERKATVPGEGERAPSIGVSKTHIATH